MSLTHTSLAAAIDIPAWLEQDRKNSWQSRIQRDRQIGIQADLPPQQVKKRVLHWWSQVQSNADVSSSGQKLASIFKRVSWLAILVGFVFGIVLASTLLHYDGSQPINVLVLLVVLVLFPLLLFLFSLLLPFFRSGSFLSGLNIGSILLAYIKIKSPALNDFFSSSRSDSARDKLLRWRLLLHSQQFGIALAVAALLTLLAHVSFSDLAFGWSTTLDFDSSSLTPWIQNLAIPWAAWFPEAVPSNQLIEQSRFFRLENGVSELSAQALTGWWKFIAMCLLVYGIGFRLLAAWFANLNYKKAVENMLLQHSEVTALLDRFNAPQNVIDSAPVVSANNKAENHSSSFNYQTADVLIRWNGANLDDNTRQHNHIVEVSSEDALQLDTARFKDLNKNDIKHIHIITKAWEPPLLEFHDLIQELRNLFGSETSISVQPVAADSASTDKVDVEIWRHSLEKLQDAKVYVV